MRFELVDTEIWNCRAVRSQGKKQRRHLYINMQLVKNGLVILVDCENGTGLNGAHRNYISHKSYDSSVGHAVIVPDSKNRNIPEVVVVRRWTVGVWGFGRGGIVG
jgi:hypothetical protein